MKWSWESTKSTSSHASQVIAIELVQNLQKAILCNNAIITRDIKFLQTGQVWDELREMDNVSVRKFAVNQMKCSSATQMIWLKVCEINLAVLQMELLNDTYTGYPGGSCSARIVRLGPH